MTSQTTRRIWSAVAERSGDTAFGIARTNAESGVALRFPPHSKIFPDETF